MPNLQPRYAVPIHYAFTGGPIMDTLFLKYAGAPSALTQQFQQATGSLMRRARTMPRDLRLIWATVIPI